MANASSGETNGSSLSTLRKAATFCAGQSVRFASVRLQTFLPSRQPARSKIAGREFRLGTISIYMGTCIAHIEHYDRTNAGIYMGTY